VSLNQLKMFAELRNERRKKLHLGSW